MEAVRPEQALRGKTLSGFAFIPTRNPGCAFLLRPADDGEKRTLGFDVKRRCRFAQSGQALGGKTLSGFGDARGCHRAGPLGRSHVIGPGTLLTSLAGNAP